MKKLVLILCFSFLLVSCKEGKLFSSLQFASRHVTVGDKTYGYRVYVPPGRDPGKKLPAMLYLHGSGARGDDNESQLEAFPRLIREDSRRFNFIIVFPQGEAKGFWDPGMLEMAVAALDQTVKEFGGDDKRLYISGWSLGAVGAWHAPILYPNKFAAVVPVAGRIIPMDFERQDSSPQILSLADSERPFEAFAAKLKDTPVWIFHGANDTSMPLTESRAMKEALNRVDAKDARYTEFEGVDHFAIEPAFQSPKLFEWLAQQRLK